MRDVCLIVRSFVIWHEHETKTQKEYFTIFNQYFHQKISFPELKNHELFQEIDWEHLHETEMPFVPCPDDSTDTSYFDGITLFFKYLAPSKLSLFICLFYTFIFFFQREIICSIWKYHL